MREERWVCNGWAYACFWMDVSDVYLDTTQSSIVSLNSSYSLHKRAANVPNTQRLAHSTDLSVPCDINTSIALYTATLRG